MIIEMLCAITYYLSYDNISGYHRNLFKNITELENKAKLYNNQFYNSMTKMQKSIIRNERACNNYWFYFFGYHDNQIYIKQLNIL